MHAAVVRSRGHEWIPLVEGHIAHGSLVELERAVRRRGQVQIEPHHSSVVTAHDDVVARGMHVDGRQPLAARHELLDQLLLHQMEHLDVLLRDHEQERSGRVEGDGLQVARGLREGVLRLAFGQLRTTLR